MQGREFLELARELLSFGMLPGGVSRGAIFMSSALKNQEVSEGQVSQTTLANPSPVGYFGDVAPKWRKGLHSLGGEHSAKPLRGRMARLLGSQMANARMWPSESKDCATPVGTET